MYIIALLLGLILPFSMPLSVGNDRCAAATVDAGKEAYLPEAENDRFFAILSDEITDYRTTPLNSDGVDDFVRLYLENFKEKNGYDYTKSSPEELAAATFRVDDPSLTEAGFRLFIHVEGESYQFSAVDASYLIYDGTLYELGFAGFGGNALTGYAVADLNGDGQAELFHSYTWCGSGVPGYEHLECFDPVSREHISVYSQPLTFDVIQNTCLAPVIDSGELKAAYGYGMWVECIQDGELKMPVGKDYGEIVYENGEYAIKEKV